MIIRSSDDYRECQDAVDAHKLAHRGFDIAKECAWMIVKGKIPQPNLLEMIREWGLRETLAVQLEVAYERVKGAFRGKNTPF